MGLDNVADTRIGSSEFGDFQYARFLLWAFLVRQSKGGLLRNVAVARTEANEANIQQMAAFYCEAYGISEKELMQRIMEVDSRSESLVGLHRTLEEEAVSNPDANLSVLPKRETSQKKRGRNLTQGK